jgi:hypothetical protein
MAALFPAIPPDAPAPRCAEERFVRSLAALPDPWRVYRGLTWYDTSGGGVREGEADVVLLHPEHGLLVLEVKGGGIAFDGDTGRWTSTNHAGCHPIQNPFAQAQRSVKFLNDEIRGRWLEISDGPVVAATFDRRGLEAFRSLRSGGQASVPLEISLWSLSARNCLSND